jgi:hypothetical protein
MTDLATLAEHLRRRRAIIADHAWRERDASGHLAALREISEKIAAAGDELRGRIPPRLDHFLGRCSFDKALAFIEGMA